MHYEKIKPYLMSNSLLDESNMLHSKTKNNNSPKSPHTPLWKRGAGGDFKWVGGGLLDKENIISPAERKKLDGLIECILCGLCFSACPVTSLNEDYYGPAALLKLGRFMEDKRDGYKERIATGITKQGVLGCRNVFNCQEVCPKNLTPAKTINRMRLKIFNTK